MNGDILFTILLYCDIDTIQSFSCAKKSFLLSRKFSPKQRNYFWVTKFSTDGLILVCHKRNTIEWIHEYRKVSTVTLSTNDMVAKLLALKTSPWSGVYIYIRDPVKILKILPSSVHQKTSSNYEHKVSFTKKDDIFTLYYDLFNRRGRRTKSTIVSIEQMTSILWYLCYYNDHMDCHIQ